MNLGSFHTTGMINLKYQKVLMINFNDCIHNEIISMNKNNSFVNLERGEVSDSLANTYSKLPDFDT